MFPTKPGLNEYAETHGVHVDYRPFALELFNESNDLIGVLEAFSSYSSIHIQDLWIDKLHRGKGYGRKLVNKLEELYAHKGFNNINLVTCAFQAPEFYKKCGFTVEFVRENIQAPLLTVTFFVKFF
jgi:GNAT superfamily N-acetyltransferase